MQPLCSKKNPAHLVPVLTYPLILHALKLASEISEKIFIVGLEVYKEKVVEILDIFNTNSEYISIDNYMGTFKFLCDNRDLFRTKNLLILKSNNLLLESIKKIYAEFQEKVDSKILVFFRENKNSKISGFHKNKVVFYGDKLQISPIGFLRHKKISFRNNLEVCDFYFIKRELLVCDGRKSFKNDFLPHVASAGKQHQVRFKMFREEYFQMRNWEEYKKSIFSLKRILKFSDKEAHEGVFYRSGPPFDSRESIICHSSIIGDCSLRNSVIERGVLIRDGCVIENSIILSKSVINRNCIIRNCIIREKTEVEESTLLENVNIGCEVKVGEDEYANINLI